MSGKSTPETCGKQVENLFRWLIQALQLGSTEQSTVFELMNWSRGQPGQRRFLLSFCATRAFTIFFTSAVGSGLSVGNWMVPLDVEKPLSSFLNASITDAVGNKLQWLENAANHTSHPLYLNAGIP